MDAPADGGVGGTYVGNPVAQAAALAVLDVIDDEGLVERVGGDRRDDPRAHGRLAGALARRSATCAGSARCSRSSSSTTGDEGAGGRPRLPRRRRGASRAGCCSSSAGVHGNCIRVLVPLVITDAELDEALDVWEEALDSCALVPDAAGYPPSADGRRRPRRTGTSSRSSSAPAACRASTARTTGCSTARSRSRSSTSTTATTTEYVERFRREARSVATLSHPNIVTVIDRGEHDGRQFIVFEYVDGENLKQLIQRRRAAAGRDARSSSRCQIARGLVVRAPAGARPPRREAAERALERERPGEGDRLRDRALARRAARGDADRHGARHLRLHRARAGAGAAASTSTPMSTRSASCSTSC